MSTLKMLVSDISGTRTNEVEAPDDVPVNRVLVVLIERMNLPINSPDGQLMSYKLHHRRTGSQLLDNQTLGQAGVVDGDELRLQPEITAGARRREPARGGSRAFPHADQRR
jgi:WXG100 protein secretion system (Wss), protein YukD